MKKLFNNRFLFILASSLIVLIVLGIGAFYLFDDSDATFVKSGYVLNPLSSKVEKYFFDENVSYKENLSSMVEFKDVDDKEVSVLRDSFLHYLDNSLSFLKNGAILDLNSIKGNGAVIFYNITNESIIEKTDDGYVIKNSGKDIVLNNFIGRINDDKYIIVGDLIARIPGNATNVEADYFEIVYVEEGVVNIENKDVKYQVAADGTLIYIGSSLVVDLGDKKITNNGEDVMSITAITINGDENIEIIPKAPEEDENGTGGGADGTGDGSGTGTGTGDGTGSGSGGGGGGGGAGGSGTGEGDGTGTGGGAGDGAGGTGSGNVETTKDVMVTLKDANIGSTYVNVTFDVYNRRDEDRFMLKVTNLDTGRTVDMVAVEVLEDVEIQVNLLSPNTKYLFTVINEYDNGKYFQKIFETNDFGIKLEKAYATDSEIAYRVSISEGTDITNAKLTLYKFNEETKKNEIVTTGYYDSEKEEMVYEEKVTPISKLDGNIEGVHEIIYDGLESNTIYTAVLDEFSVASSNFKDIYNLTLTSMTLKKTPTFSNMTADKDVGAGSFKLSLGNIIDEDNAIVDYTYLIYEQANPNDTIIDPITKGNASPIEVKIGDGDQELMNDTNYFYKVVIQYFDNEKYIEFVTTDVINFSMGSDPYITVVPDDSKISHDTIGATIYLTDNSCLISMPGREKCSGVSTTVIEVYKINSLTGDKIKIPDYPKVVDFVVEDDVIKYDLFLENLQSGTTYSIDVRADINNTPEVENDMIFHTDESKKTITTKTLSNFYVKWGESVSNDPHVVSVPARFEAEKGSGTLSPDDSAAAIEKVVIELYEGKNIEELHTQEPIDIEPFYNNDTFNIKEQFYDREYIITTDGTFGLSIQDLKDLNEGKLAEAYTIIVKAYYDRYENNPVVLGSSIISVDVNPFLLMDSLADPVLDLEARNNTQSGKIFDKLNNGGTTVGYKVFANFDRTGLEAKFDINSFNIYVYNKMTGKKVKFYVKNADGELVLVDKITPELAEGSGYYEDFVYMGYGTEYGVTDNDIMSRGNEYLIGYEINVTERESKVESIYPIKKAEDAENLSPTGNGLYHSTDATIKETPKLGMYVAYSTKDSIKYKYEITDPDNSLYRESLDSKYYFYYTRGDDATENKIELNDKVDGKISGEFVIDGLSNGDVYRLYYKKNTKKTGVLEDDILDYFNGDEDNGSRMFDGFYDVSLPEYNFTYSINNNNGNDNKVTIVINASQDMLDRILSYKFHFEDEDGHTYDVEDGLLTECGENNEKRCYSVSYVTLKEKGMKSNQNDENKIFVTVEAVYDTGLSGYDYVTPYLIKKGSNYILEEFDKEVHDYPFVIMQNNSTPAMRGLYVSYSTAGTLTNWNPEVDFVKGYYRYNKNGNKINYASALNTKISTSVTVGLEPGGYSTSVGVLNPKMVDVKTMNCDGDNYFSFSSITPKVSVTEKTQLINGAVMELMLSGADINDFVNEGNDTLPEYNLYIEVWSDEESARYEENGLLKPTTSRPTLKVPLDPTNLEKAVEAYIDGLYEGHDYYFNVYALMYKNNKEEMTRLFDAKYKADYIYEVYTFNSLSSSGVFHTLGVAHKINDKVAYGNRDLVTTINLKSYKAGYDYNFDLFYVFCDADVYCDHQGGYIFKKDIAGDTKQQVVDDIDISKYDFEFGKRNAYSLRVYAVSQVYGAGSNELRDNPILLNAGSTDVTLSSLVEPYFTVEREAFYENGEYYIDFKINAIDPYRTLVGNLIDGSLRDEESLAKKGKYFVRLKDQNGNLVGTLQELDEEGLNYVNVDVSNYQNGDYSKHPFNAKEPDKKIRITGLNENAKYTIEVFSNAYVNNYNEFIPKEQRTYEVKKPHTVYSSGKYGVSFGSDLLFSATEKSIIIKFLGGSGFDVETRNLVKEVTYTIGLWDAEEDDTSTIGGTYIIGLEEGNKQFERKSTDSDWRFIIDPPGMINQKDQTYSVSVTFKVVDPFDYDQDGDGFAIVGPFAGKAEYNEDELE